MLRHSCVRITYHWCWYTMPNMPTVILYTPPTGLDECCHFSFRQTLSIRHTHFWFKSRSLITGSLCQLQWMNMAVQKHKTCVFYSDNLIILYTTIRYLDIFLFLFAFVSLCSVCVYLSVIETILVPFLLVVRCLSGLHAARFLIIHTQSIAVLLETKLVCVWHCRLPFKVANQWLWILIK